MLIHFLNTLKFLKWNFIIEKKCEKQKNKKQYPQHKMKLFFVDTLKPFKQKSIK